MDILELIEQREGIIEKRKTIKKNNKNISVEDVFIKEELFGAKGTSACKENNIKQKVLVKKR